MIFSNPLFTLPHINDALTNLHDDSINHTLKYCLNAPNSAAFVQLSNKTGWLSDEDLDSHCESQRQHLSLYKLQSLAADSIGSSVVFTKAKIKGRRAIKKNLERNDSEATIDSAKLTTYGFRCGLINDEFLFDVIQSDDRKHTINDCLSNVYQNAAKEFFTIREIPFYFECSTEAQSMTIHAGYSMEILEYGNLLPWVSRMKNKALIKELVIAAIFLGSESSHTLEGRHMMHYFFDEGFDQVEKAIEYLKSGGDADEMEDYEPIDSLIYGVRNPLEFLTELSSVSRESPLEIPSRYYSHECSRSSLASEMRIRIIEAKQRDASFSNELIELLQQFFEQQLRFGFFDGNYHSVDHNHDEDMFSGELMLMDFEGNESLSSMVESEIDVLGQGGAEFSLNYNAEHSRIPHTESYFVYKIADMGAGYGFMLALENCIKRGYQPLC